jgi:hypothetical protein
LGLRGTEMVDATTTSRASLANRPVTSSDCILVAMQKTMGVRHLISRQIHSLRTTTCAPC